MRSPGCFVASISDELYGPILDAVPSQPSATESLDCIQKPNHQPKQATSNFNTGWDIPGTSAVINYALQMIPVNLNARARRIFIQEAYNLVLTYPYLVTLLEEHVFDKFSASEDSQRMSDFCLKLFELGRSRLYPESMIYALYFAVRYDLGIDFDEDKMIDAASLNDCILNVLLHRFSTKHSLKKLNKVLRKKSDAIKSSGDHRLVDRQWLFVYEMWSKEELNGNGQQFLANLKQAGFSFCDFSPTAQDQRIAALLLDSPPPSSDPTESPDPCG